MLSSFQLVGSPSGVTGLCYQHSVSEGIAVVNFLQKIVKDIMDNELQVTLPKDEELASEEWRKDKGIRMLEWEGVEGLKTQVMAQKLFYA